MPVIQTEKIIITDLASGRLIRMNVDPLGDEWEEWGLYIGGDINIGGIDIASYDDYLDVELDEENMILYYATDSKGVLKLDLKNDTAAVYDVASGSLRNDVCHGVILTSDKSRLVVLHDTDGISIIDPSTGVQLASHAAAGATCGFGVLNRAETEIVVWKSFNASLPAKVDLSTGAVTSWSWGSMPNAGTKYMDDCDWSADDSILYVELHFSSTPSGGHRQAHVLVDPITMTPSSWVWLDNGDYSNLYENVAAVDVDRGYYAHSYRFSSSQDKLRIWRLSDNTLLATYDTTTSPVFGYKAQTNWATRCVRCGKSRERGSLHVFVNQYYKYASPTNAILTVYEINPTTLLWSKLYDFCWSSEEEYQEIDKEYGADPSPVYISRRVPDGVGSPYLGKFHEWQSYFGACNTVPGNGISPHVFTKDFPWTRPYGLYRREDNGVIYVLNRPRTPGTAACNRVVRFLDWNSGGRLALGYRWKLEGEGSFSTGAHVGCIESADLVFYDSLRPSAYGVIFPDFEYSDVTDIEINYGGSTLGGFSKVIGDFLYWCFYTGAPHSKYSINKYDQTGALVDWHMYNELGPGSDPADLWIDPEDGRHYIACADRVVRYDDLAGTGYASFGMSGSGMNQFSGSQGIHGDTSHLYIVDTGNYRIVRIDKAVFDGTGWVTVGSRGFSGPGKLSYPVKISAMVVESGIPEPTGFYLPPDMIESVNLMHEFFTSAFKTFSEVESRAGHVALPIRTLTFQLSTMEPGFMAHLFRKLQELRAEEYFHIPVWPYAMLLNDPIIKNDTEITVVDASARELPLTGVLLAFSTVDRSEAVEYISRIGSEFILSSGVSQDFDVEDTIIVPCMTVFMSSQQELSRFELFKVLATLSFEELIISLS
jgi:hypothetical protein